MGVKEQQLGFSDWERSRVRKQTRKEKFLYEMEAVLPFSTLVKLMQPFHPQAGPQGGRPPYGLETMLRIHLMQNGWSLTDAAVEDALIDTGAPAPSAPLPGFILLKITSRMPPPSWCSPMVWNNITWPRRSSRRWSRTWKRRACCCGRAR